MVMIVCTDSPAFAEQLLGEKTRWNREIVPGHTAAVTELSKRLFSFRPPQSAKVLGERFWDYSFFAEAASQSQFDILAEASSKELQGLPDRILCCAGSGMGFHGQRNRPWAALPGNVHLTAFFRPNHRFANGGIGFTVLSVVSVLETLETLGVGRAQVKWVNDILVGRAKIGGVLVHIKTQGEIVTSALVGIGLNVETTPIVDPTPFVPEVEALKSLFKDPSCTYDQVFRLLAGMLAKNYDGLIEGKFQEFLETYRKRSVVVGRNVTIYEDTDVSELNKIAGGRVTSIGDNLELKLEGLRDPVWRGRLVLEG